MRSKQKVRSVFNKYQKIPNSKPGLLGNGAGVVDDPSRTGYVFVRIAGSPPISVVNKRCASINDLSVWVGYDPLEPSVLQILSVRSIQRGSGGVGVGQSLQVGKHGDTHSWEGRDPAYSDIRLLMPFRPQANGTMFLNMYRGISFLDGEWRGVTGQNINMSAYVPSTGALYSLVYVNTVGLLDAVTGSLKDVDTLYPSDAPDPIPGTIPVALVRLWSGMSGIVEARTGTDIADVRWPGLYTDRIGTAIGTGTPTANLTIPITISGTTYYLLASTTAT